MELLLGVIRPLMTSSTTLPNAHAESVNAPTPPSEWVVRWTHLIDSSVPLSSQTVNANELNHQSEPQVLDLACGSGRHMKWLSEQGYKVLGVDKDASSLEQCRSYGEILQADLEQDFIEESHQTQSTERLTQIRDEGRLNAQEINTDAPKGYAVPQNWPLGNRQFNAVIVTNYLWRPLFPHLLRALRKNGVFIYETFALGHEALGRPRRAEFLLKPGELLQICANLQIVAYEEVLLTHPERFVQRIVAIRAPKEVSNLERFWPTSR